MPNTISDLVRRSWTEARVRTNPPPSGPGMAVSFALAVVALYFGRDVFVPLALAILLSFVLAPLVVFLRRMHIGRVVAVVVAVVLAFIVIFGIGSLIGSQLADLATNIPQYQSTISRKIQFLHNAAAESGLVERASSMLTEFQHAVTVTPSNHGGTAPNSAGAPPAKNQPPKPIPVEIHQPPPAPLDVIRNIIGPLSSPLATTGIVIIFVIFILLQREDLRDRFIRLAGRGDLQRTTRAVDDGVRRLSRYFLMQSVINAAFGTLIGIGLFFIGVPNPVLWGILAMLLRFIPYIGPPIAAFFPAALAIAVVPGWSMFGWTVGLFLVTESVTGQVVEPFLYGHSMGLSAVAVVVSAVFWTWLWGAVGLFLARPLTMCLVVLGRHVEHLQFLDVLLGDRPALAPEESFYQRMLAGDPDEAVRQAEEFLKEKPLSAYYDEVAIKGLALAQSDVNRGRLERDYQVQIKEAVDDVIDALSAGAPAPEGDGPAVVCLAGRGALDEAAASMLAQLIQKQGIAARVVPKRDGSPPNIFRLGSADVKLVCLSYMESGGFTNTRFVVQRLRRRWPRVKILLGLWTKDDVEIERRHALQKTGADFIVTSLGQATERVVAAINDAGNPAYDAIVPPSSARTPRQRDPEIK